ncbi:MAG: glycosyltransferase [Pseudomonadota bacterium]
MKKKILVYCQYVLGVGHFFRTLEIIRALEGFDVILVTGGRAVDAPLPGHVRHRELPGLMMDAGFTSLHGVDALDVDEIKQRRTKMLLDLVRQESPDLALIELYPFGRKAFGFELEPMLEFLRQGEKPCRVVCSLRDILVEKTDTAAYETRVVKRLNRWFDAVFIHSDPRLVDLVRTFSRASDIRIPLVYTGFVTPLPDPAAANAHRLRLAPDPKHALIIVSTGSGSVGAGLLKACVRAHGLLTSPEKSRMLVLTGPYMDGTDVRQIRDLAGPGVLVETFVRDFVSLLFAADLSVSMAGYNTLMNTVAARVPALVWPFGQNREQALRAGTLAGFAEIRLLEDSDLDPGALAFLMQNCLDRRNSNCLKDSLSEAVLIGAADAVNLSGAATTAKLVTEML